MIDLDKLELVCQGGKATNVDNDDLKLLINLARAAADSLPKIKEGAAPLYDLHADKDFAEDFARLAEGIPHVKTRKLVIKAVKQAIDAHGKAERERGRRESLAAPASQAAAPTDEQIAAIHAMALNDPAVHALMTLKRRDGLGWPDVLAQMVLHLASDKAAITARALELASCASPAIILAGAAPVEAAKQRVPLASFTGTMTEVGDMKAGRGFAIEIAESTYVEVIGLTEAEVTNVAAQFYAGVTIQVIPAAPAPEAQ